MGAAAKKFNVSISTVPANPLELAGKTNGTLIVHMAVNETTDGDSRSLVEFKAIYHRLTVETAKPLFAAIGPIVCAKQDIDSAQLLEIQNKVVSALAALTHPLTD